MSNGNDGNIELVEEKWGYNKVEQLKSKKFSELLDISHWRLTPYQVLSLAFLVLIFLGTILLMLPISHSAGESMNFVDALFTATSAVCVTGLVVVDTGTYFSFFGQMVIVILIQAGAFGIMTMATLVAVLMRRKIQLKDRLVMQEALNQLTLAGMVRLTIYIIQVALLIEFIGGTILAMRFYPDFGLEGIYYGYWHAASAFCNAGFDVFGGSGSDLTVYAEDAVVNMTITLLIIMGGLGFTVLADLWHNRKFRFFSLQTKVVLATSTTLILLGTLCVFFLEYSNPDTIGTFSLSGKILASYFQSVTARTAGYATIHTGALTDAAAFMVVILMFIGASPSSTGSGIKTTTFAVIISAVWCQIRGKNEPQLFYRRIPTATVYKAFAIFFLAATMILFVTMMLSISEKFSFIDILFEVVSAFSTTGLSRGITADLSVHGKIWIIVTMFVGRLGPMTVALALALKNRKSVIQYPEGKITIG